MGDQAAPAWSTVPAVRAIGGATEAPSAAAVPASAHGAGGAVGDCDGGPLGLAVTEAVCELVRVVDGDRVEVRLEVALRVIDGVPERLRVTVRVPLDVWTAVRVLVDVWTDEYVVDALCMPEGDVLDEATVASTSARKVSNTLWRFIV